MYRPSTQPRTRRDYEDIARYERSLAFHNGPKSRAENPKSRSLIPSEHWARSTKIVCSSVGPSWKTPR